MDLSFSEQGEPFPATRWSLVAIAGRGSEASRVALDELCGKYWRPVYAFVRQLGRSPHDAEDLTQAYFSNLLERGYLRCADPGKGRFRAFLIRDLKFFLSNEAGKGRAEKRGGRVSILPLDVDWAERLHEAVERTTADPDAYFDRQWALETVRLAKSEVAESYRARGKEQLFSLLQAGLVESPDAAAYARWGEALAMNEGALKVALHRLRERFRAALREQILQTVASEEDLQEEMQHLFRALARASDGT